MTETRRAALARRRRALGLSQEDLADRLRVDARTVGRWEAGTGEPQPWLRRPLAELLQLGLDDLESVLQQTGGAGGVDCAEGADVPGLIDALDRLDAGYATTPSIALLPTANGHVDQISSLRDRARSPRERRQLDILEAKARIFLGQVLWDAAQRRSHDVAEAQLDQATHLAERCRDPAVESAALLRRSFLALYGRRSAEDGLALTVRASEAARDVSPTIVALANLHSAEAHAMLGDATACRALLKAADGAASRIDDDDPGLSLYTPSVAARMTGSCLIRLGDYDAALSALTQAELESPPAKTLAMVVGNSALALALSGEVDGAAERLSEVIDLIEMTRGGGALNIAFQVGRAIHRQGRAAAASDVIDRLLSLMAG
jgi:transcriptional regulator with XRE-family HTH domain